MIFLHFKTLRYGVRRIEAFFTLLSSRYSLEERGMQLGFSFFFTSIMLGIGLAMDAFSVSLADGLNEPDMRKRRMCLMAGVFAAFQGLMPLIGWVCVHTIVQYFTWFEQLIPWIALILLSYIGVKMIHDSLTGGEESGQCGAGMTFGAILLQGVATSIDALSVGFTIAEYDLTAAVLAALLIAAVTFVICTAGIFIGRKAGTRLSGKAGILGGSILIFIGLEIFISSFF